MSEPTAFNPNDYLIMAVDDIPSNLRLLQGLLMPSGYRVTLVTRGQQVLERVLELKPDLILLDLMMPEMDGIEVCTLLKASAATSPIPIIFLTASHGVEHLTEAFKQGAVDYVTKPFNPLELLARVRTHVELNQLRKQAQIQATWEAISRQIVQDIHASINLQDILDNTVQALQRSLSADRVLVCSGCHPQECRLRAIAGKLLPNPRCCQPVQYPDQLHSPPTMRQMATQQLGLTEEQSVHPEHSKTAVLQQSPQALCLPIQQNGQLWGSLSIQNDTTSQPWSDYEVNLLSLIVQQLEISIQHAALHQSLQEANAELQRVSNTDGLTQVANRRCFDQRLSQEWHRLQREQQPLSLILCDIDYFKQFNDTYGHPRGDVCLATVARVLQSCLKRPADLVARYGGEEFGMLLPHTDLLGAIEVVQQVQDLIAALKIIHASRTQGQYITLSFGIYSGVPELEADVSMALAQADRALYAAKKSGRDRYAIAAEALTL